MRRLILFQIIFLILFLFSTSKSFSQRNEELMNQANQFYQEENFTDAVNTYEQIIKEGYVSEALFYNLGNAYYRTGKLGLAVLYYEKGLKLAPSDEDLRYNLSIANARTIDRITGVPKIFIVQWWESLLAFFPVRSWSYLVIIVYVFFLATLAIYFVAKTGRMRRYGFYFASFSFAALILSTVLFVSSYVRESSANFGVLVVSEISVKQSPDEKSTDVFVIHEGLKFSLEDEVGGWSKIRLSDGKIGWIPNSSFGKI